MTPETERELLSEIYAAGIEPQRWPRVMQLLGTAVGKVNTHIIDYDTQSDLSPLNTSFGYDPEYLQSFEDYYHRVNVWAPGFASKPLHRAIACQEMLSDAEVKKSELYSDWLKPQEKISRGGGAVLIRRPDRALMFGGNIREKDAEVVEPLWLDLVGRVAPAILLAVEVSRRIAGLTLDNLLLRSGGEAAAAIVLAADRRILMANGRGEELLTEGHLLRIAQDGRLAPLRDPRAEQGLAERLSVLFSQGKGAALFPLSVGFGARLVPVDTSVLALAPVGPLWRMSGTVALLLVEPRVAAAGPSRRLAALGLSDAEIAVARGLAEGRTADEIANGRGTSVHTVRNQIKSILSKTDCRRQADVVALVLRLTGQE